MTVLLLIPPDVRIEASLQHCILPPEQFYGNSENARKTAVFRLPAYPGRRIHFLFIRTSSRVHAARRLFS
jgi:hypothetical protein